MTKPNNDDIDIYELLSRADELLEEKEDKDFLADPAVFAPETEDPANSPMVYRNAANGYGQNIRNAANHYGAAPVRPQVQPPVPQPARPTQAEQAVSSIRAYNADFHTERERTPKTVPEQTAYIPPQPAAPAPAPEPPKKQKKKGGCLKKLLIPVALIAVVVILFNMLIKPPMTDSPIGERRPGVSTVLLCGADIGGQRTDTMMLLYVDSVKGEAGLLTLPRDTYTVTDYGSSNKLNSAYGRNGGGEEGMEVLFDYVQDTIGYRPDGYVLIELPMLRDLIDLFGGIDFHVPQDMNSPGSSGSKIFLEEGMQHLDGEKALALLRFRYGYVNQDLGRQDVQKQFIKACVKQWLTPKNLGKIGDVLDLFKSESLTNLTTGNFMWFGWNLLKAGFSDINTDTLPGYSSTIDDLSYYVLYPGEVAEMIQDRYNPYQVEITRDMLDIATE